MNTNPYIFRAYDIRGIYPQDLNEDVVRKICKAYVLKYPFAKKIVISQDTRKSSPGLAKAIIGELISLGKEVINIGIAPDPLFYFSIFHYNFDGGFMVAGSHNPKEYNGLTLHIRKSGQEISEDVAGKDLEEIRDMVVKDNFPGEEAEIGKLTNFDPSEEYIDYVSKKIILKRSLKIIFDTGNGAVSYLPEKVFKKLGCEVKTIYGEFNGDFPHHLPDPYQEENIKDLQKIVAKEKADLGFAYDGDGDRVVPIDNKGRTITGDSCLLLLARQALKKKKGPIVHDMRVSQTFLDEMEREGIKTYFSISHHNAVIKKIIETGAVFGGEITLHFLFPLDYYLCDEAIFASLKLSEIFSEQESIAEYVDSLPKSFASPEVFIETTDAEKFNIIKNLQEYLLKNDYDFVDIDGARINFLNGWALARAANTTPMIKCRFEGKRREDLIEIEKKALDIFKNTGIPVTKKTYADLGL